MEIPGEHFQVTVVPWADIGVGIQYWNKWEFSTLLQYLTLRAWDSASTYVLQWGQHRKVTLLVQGSLHENFHIWSHENLNRTCKQQILLYHTHLHFVWGSLTPLLANSGDQLALVLNGNERLGVQMNRKWVIRHGRQSRSYSNPQCNLVCVTQHRKCITARLLPLGGRLHYIHTQILY